MPALSPEDQKLLWRTLGVRVAADGSLLVPLVPALKAHSWTDFFGLIGILGMVPVLARSDGPSGMSALLAFGAYFSTLVAFHCCVFLHLLLRRRLILPAQSNDVVLHQRRTAFRFTFGFEPAVEARSHTGMLRVDGGEFRIKRRLFVSRRAVAMAIARLEGWLATRSREVKRSDAEQPPSQGAGLFLALTDVVHVSPGKVSFRVAMERYGVMVPYVILGTVGTVLCGLAVAARMVDFSVMLPILWLANAICVVLLRKIQWKITVEAGVGIRIKKGKAETSHPGSGCRFKMRPAATRDEDAGPNRPQIELECPETGEWPCIVAKSRDLDEKDLAIIAHAMNRYLWGGNSAPKNTG